MLAVLAILVAGTSLALGWLLDETVLVVVALAASLAGLAAMAAGPARAWWARRHEASTNTEPSTADTGDESTEDGAAEDGAAEHEPSAAPSDSRVENPTQSDENDAPTPRACGHTLHADSSVHVIPGRSRFHSRDCDLLTGHSAEIITLVEAREESFTPCTACIHAP